MSDENDALQENDQLPSKSRLKRESEALQKIGEQLIALKSRDLDAMQLPEKLECAVREARKLHARGGLKRQKQYIGKIMREIDSDSIIRQLQHLQHRHDASNAAFKKTEYWRDRLISDDRQALTDIVELYPDMERQRIHQLVRQARKETAAGKPPAASRKLFRYLREFIDPQQLQKQD